VVGSLDTVRAERYPSWSYGAQLSIPLGNITARNRYKSSKAQKAQALLTLKRLEQDILVEVDNAVKLAQANFERIQATREARDYAEAALLAEQKKLENGKSTSFVVLSLQRDLTLRRSQEIRALADYNNALSGLSFSEGRTLERNGLTVAPMK
jgi:outer membrane protein TolC